MGRGLVVCMTLCIGAWRFVITPRLDLPTATGSYEAVAHLWDGLLFGAGFVFLRVAKQLRNSVEYLPRLCDQYRKEGWSCLWLGGSIAILELVMFILQKWGWL